MPIDFTKPSTTGNYSVGVLQPINDAMKALAQWLDPAVAGTLTGTPTGAYRINSGSLERFNGTSWVGQSINGITFSSNLVGIGGAPSTKLDVMDTVDVTSTVRTTGTANSALLSLSSGNGTTSGRYAYVRFLNNETTSQDWRLGTYGNSSFTLRNQTTSNNILIIDTPGNTGFGVVPSAWGTNFRAVQVGAVGSLAYDNNFGQVCLGTNFYMAGSGAGTPTYLTSNAAARFDVTQTGFQFRQVGSGTASSSFTWSTVATVDTTGIRPGATGTQDLGSGSLRWNNLYANTVDVGGYKAITSLSIPFGRRNLLVNGGFNIWQRYGLSSSGYYSCGSEAATWTADYWRVVRKHYGSGGTPATVQAYKSSVDTTTEVNSLAIAVQSVAAGAALTSGQKNYLVQRIDHDDFRKVAFAGAGAKPLTLTFWARATTTGTFSVALYLRTSVNGKKSFVSTYTINTAFTWEKKTISIPAFTSGTFPEYDTIVVALVFSLGCGSSHQTSTLNAWQTGRYLAATGETQLISLTNHTLSIGAVQLEASSFGTPFEHPSFLDELRLCQRLYCKSVRPQDPLPSSGYYNGAIAKSPDATCNYMSFGTIYLPVDMHNENGSYYNLPTLTIYNPENGGTGTGWNASAGVNVPITTLNIGQRSFSAYVNNQSVTVGQYVHFNYAVEVNPYLDDDNDA